MSFEKVSILDEKVLTVPIYGFITSVLLYALQLGLYRCVDVYQRISGIMWHSTKIPFIDNKIPVVAPFAIIYILSFFFWLAGPIAASKCNKRFFRDFVAGIIIAELTGALVFACYPTGMDREIEGLLNNNGGFFNNLLQIIYANDGGRYALNLCPSYHCLISTSCYLGVAHRKEISKGYRVFSFIFCILVYISTVTLKQHYFIDIPCGACLAISAHFISVRFHLGNIGMKSLNK